jgi:hypothetical protein
MYGSLDQSEYADWGAQWLKSQVAQWIEHPTDKLVDVSILDCTGFNFTSFDVLSLPAKRLTTTSLIRERSLQLGEEVFLAGLFSLHFGKERNIPIVRIGNVAAMPEEKISTKLGAIDAYLIETRSIAGLSGSPVFTNLATNRFSSSRSGDYYLLGLMQGHWNTRESDEGKVNVGVGIVVPSEKIMEVIDQKKLKDKREDLLQKQQASTLPEMDSIPADESAVLTKEEFEAALKKVGRRLGPKP